MLTEKEKMLKGDIYDPTDSELAELRIRAHRLSQQYNLTYETDIKQREDILNQLLRPFSLITAYLLP